MRFLPAFALAALLAACSSTTAQLTGREHRIDNVADLAEVPVKGYTSAANKFSLVYPPVFAMTDGVTVDVNGEPLRGVSFLAPAGMTNGTLFSDARIHVARKNGRCSWTPTERVKVGENDFMSVSWSSEHNGEIKQQKIYFTEHGDGCYSITLYTTSCDGCRDNPKPFVRKPLTDAFRKISASLKLY